jgi:type II secretory pathway pseudopilin PulG
MKARMPMNKRNVRRGFSFTEVLFAVMVLGIGFIMIAAIFPVTIRQTQTTLEETQSVTSAKAALAYLQGVASNTAFPPTVKAPAKIGDTPTPPIMSLPDGATFATIQGEYFGRGNAINTANPRLAWVPFYRRGYDIDGKALPFAEVYMISMQSRNRSQYNAGVGVRDFDPGASGYSNLDAHPAKVTVKYDSSIAGGRVTFSTGGDFAAPGAYVLISDVPSREDTGQAAAIGRVYQLSAFDAGSGSWTLAPGGDMLSTADGAGTTDAQLSGASAYIVGRGLVDPNDPTTVGGPAQDTGVYVGFVQIPVQ